MRRSGLALYKCGSQPQVPENHENIDDESCNRVRPEVRRIQRASQDNAARHGDDCCENLADEQVPHPAFGQDLDSLAAARRWNWSTTRRMRIIFVNSSCQREGGIETYLQTVMPALQSAGHEVSLCYELDAHPLRKRIDLPSGSPSWCVARMGLGRT